MKDIILKISKRKQIQLLLKKKKNEIAYLVTAFLISFSKIFEQIGIHKNFTCKVGKRKMFIIRKYFGLEHYQNKDYGQLQKWTIFQKIYFFQLNYVLLFTFKNSYEKVFLIFVLLLSTSRNISFHFNAIINLIPKQPKINNFFNIENDTLINSI